MRVTCRTMLTVLLFAPVGAAMADPIADGSADQRLQSNDNPPQHRRYRFRLFNETYDTILDEFAATTGLEFVGDAPAGHTSFDCGREEMSFDLAFNRLRVLLFRHPGQYVLVRDGNGIRVIPAEGVRHLVQHSDIFTSDANFLEAECSPETPVAVLCACRNDACFELSVAVGKVPTYLRVTPYHDSKDLVIFGVAEDVRHYLGLLGMLDVVGGDGQRTVFRMQFNALEPAAAAAELKDRYADLVACSSVESPDDLARIREATASAYLWTDWAHRAFVVVCPKGDEAAIRARLADLDQSVHRRTSSQPASTR